MKFTKLLAVGTVAMACAASWAEDYQVLNIDLSNGSAHFGVSHYEPGGFTDIFSFVNGPVLADASASLVTIALGGVGFRDIDFTSAFLNDTIPFPAVAAGFFEATFVTASNVSGPAFKITVNGVAKGVSGAQHASYSGTMNVSAVPEPETYAMMLAGLGAIGFLASRRRRLG